jgi:ACS family hexuronate transporter-like MFS transporter
VYTLASDLFPRSAVASVIGIAGFAGAAGGVLFQRATGRILDATGHNYAPLFLVCGVAYITAWTIIHCLVPHLEPVRLTAAPGPLTPARPPSPAPEQAP